MKKIVTFFYFVISLHTVLAQIPQEDSLIKILSSTKVDSVKVNALVRLSSYNQSSQQGLNFAMAALKLTLKIKYASCYPWCHCNTVPDAPPTARLEVAMAKGV